PDPFHFIEFGPGEGLFAADFLREAARTPSFLAALRYLLVETSPVLRERQRARLSREPSLRLAWVDEAELDRRAPLTGCLFANEVLDAFPVHRVVGGPGEPLEVHVTGTEGALRETLAPLSTPALGRFIGESGIALASGQEADINLA